MRKVGVGEDPSCNITACNCSENKPLQVKTLFQLPGKSEILLPFWGCLMK